MVEFSFHIGSTSLSQVLKKRMIKLCSLRNYMEADAVFRTGEAGSAQAQLFSLLSLPQW